VNEKQRNGRRKAREIRREGEIRGKEKIELKGEYNGSKTKIRHK
jgi:hypothetical protein